MKVNKFVDGHASNKYHTDAVEAAMNLRSIEQPQVNIDTRLNTELLNVIQDNKHVVKCCAQCILYCGRQCIV